MKVTLLTIATDRYADFAIRLIDSFSENVPHNFECEWLVFTNKEEHINSKLVTGRNLKITTVFQKHEEWPLPTLLRYQTFDASEELINGDLVIYVDADMLITPEFNFMKLLDLTSAGKPVLVAHPGFYRPKRLERVKFYLFRPGFLLRDSKLMITRGALGSWETRKASKAYVKRSNRRIYVCGGIWFGNNSAIKNLIKNLEKHVAEDLEKEVIARFHDESHLNWFASSRDVLITDPSLCFAPSYPNLRTLKPEVIAIDKDNSSKWVR